MADQSIPGAGSPPAPGAVQAAASTWWRAYRLGVRLMTGDELPTWANLEADEQDLTRGAVAAVLTIHGGTEARDRAIRETARGDQLAAQLEDLTNQLIAAEEALALVGWDQVPAPYALTDPGPDFCDTPWDEL
jgi:hypothetical protein